MVQLLLDSGDDPNRGLSEAIFYRQSDIVHLLLASGAAQNVNARIGLHLYKACEVGDLELVKLLVPFGANCDRKCLKLACGMGMNFNLDCGFSQGDSL